MGVVGHVDRVAGGVPRNTYRARDGQWLVVSATTDPQVARVLATLGVDDPATKGQIQVMKSTSQVIQTTLRSIRHRRTKPAPTIWPT